MFGYATMPTSHSHNSTALPSDRRKRRYAEQEYCRLTCCCYVYCREKLAQLLQATGTHCDEETVDCLFAFMDFDRNGTVTFEVSERTSSYPSGPRLDVAILVRLWISVLVAIFVCLWIICFGVNLLRSDSLTQSFMF